LVKPDQGALFDDFAAVMRELCAADDAAQLRLVAEFLTAAGPPPADATLGLPSGGPDDDHLSSADPSAVARQRGLDQPGGDVLLERRTLR